MINKIDDIILCNHYIIHGVIILLDAVLVSSISLNNKFNLI